jgi:hypothetical protein
MWASMASTMTLDGRRARRPRRIIGALSIHVNVAKEPCDCVESHAGNPIRSGPCDGVRFVHPGPASHLFGYEGDGFVGSAHEFNRFPKPEMRDVPGRLAGDRDGGEHGTDNPSSR